MEVQVLTNQQSDRIKKGEELPFLTQVETGSSVSILVDSKDRISGTPSNFRASFRSRIPRVRYIQLEKVIIPKIPNVNPNNYSLQIKHALGTTAVFNLPSGIYSTTALSNQLTNSINAAFVTAGIADTVTTVYNQNTRTFTISSVGLQNMFIVNSCSFITRGQWLVPFASQPITDVPSSPTIQSGIASMLYSRYLTVASQAANLYSFASSITTRASQPNQLVGIVNICEIYTDADFDISIPYTSVYKTLPVNGCKISVLNTQRSLFEEIDLSIADEYGTQLDTAFDLGAGYPTSVLGMVFLFDCSF